MKKTRLLIVLLSMLFVASGYAQDSYHQAVKDYLTATGQFEKTKLVVSGMGMLFDKNGQVNIDQLTKRYLDEQYEADMTDYFVTMMQSRGMTEADVRELAALLSSPEGKAFEEHQQEWLVGFASDLLMPFLKLSEMDESELDEDMEDPEVMENLEDMNYGLDSFFGSTQPNADIDPVYAEKFKKVILESDFIKKLLDDMLKKMTENEDDEWESLKEQPASSDEFFEDLDMRKAFNDWVTEGVPNILLNNAYGILTLEDLDYAAILYANEAYCKFNSADSMDDGGNQMGNVALKYMDWMKEQGAPLSEDPEAAVGFLKSLLNLGGLDEEE